MVTCAINVFRFSSGVSMVDEVAVYATSYRIWCSVSIGRCTIAITVVMRQLVLSASRFIEVGRYDTLDDGSAVHELIVRIVGFPDSRSYAPNSVYNNYRLSREI